ncbi:MAG: Si-specific NAD(P)(+) transhydrogenase [Alphaproteobacteria bacterium]|nr:Si-specific NAD(P)(+) transhydrogenase [Alphaproteobacteria bacterium]
MTKFDYDLFVLGSGPAGQRAAIQAAKLGKRAAIAEQRTVVGGVCINTGTIPSKTLREAVMHLSGYRERSFYGASYKVKDKITMPDLLYRTDHVIRHEIDITRHQLQRNGVEVVPGQASFLDPHTLNIAAEGGQAERVVSAEKILIAVGTEATRDPHIPFDGQQILTSDDILCMESLPRTLAVIGAGVIGLEYATLFATLGVRVTLIDRRPRLLPFVDAEIIDALIYHMRDNRAVFRLGESVASMKSVSDEKGKHVCIELDSGKKVVAEKALYSIGRTGATEALNLENAKLTTIERGLLEVNEHFQTEAPHIYAAGDVVGFPSLASTSMEQGRQAACHAFSVDADSVEEHFPFGIYTIPEISVVGRNEQELTEAGIPYEMGRAAYKEIARGQIIGDETGLLKLLFHMETRKLLGVSILGEGASELVHIGQAVIAMGGTIDYFVDTVFNYPTLAECYKTAAFDGINRLG